LLLLLLLLVLPSPILCTDQTRFEAIGIKLDELTFFLNYLAKIYYADSFIIVYSMQNWDEELAKLMEKKMKQYKDMAEAKNDSTFSGTGVQINTPITLTDYNFDEMTRKHSFLVVDFWAPWCGPCKMVSPVIDQLAFELGGKVVFGKLNVDENPTVASLFGIQSIPTLMIFKNGTAVDGILGAASKAQILATLSKHN
jgi:thioredoxin 1